MSKNILYFYIYSREYEDGDYVITIDVGPIVSAELCTCLSMLKDGIVEFVRFDGIGRNLSVRFEIDSNLGESSRGIVLFREKGLVAIAVTMTELEFWTEFFQNSYRDQVAPVDHFDVEIMGDDSLKEPGLTVVFKGMNSLPPISPEEAERLMEM